jgi:hypothetical protein
MFYEFIPAEEYYNESPTRLSLEEVELDKNYALILNTNAGLWGYSIGDTVKFVSKDPYKITGYWQDQAFHLRIWGTCDRGRSGTCALECGQ